MDSSNLVPSDHEVVPPAPIRHRFPQGERANAFTHALGLLLSILGGIWLMDNALVHSQQASILGCGIFSLALSAVYGASTLSHSFSRPKWRHFFRTLDQAFIYLLIVGTYTPFSLAYLRTTGWLLFLGLMWSIALVGFLSKILFSHRVDAVAVWIYLLLGWMPAIPALTTIGMVPAGALGWILAGGLCYTAGTVFLVYDKKWFHFHAVWHLFVIAGSTCHYLGVLWYVARPTLGN